MSKILPKEVKEIIIAMLKVLFSDAKIYLFGSRATGQAQDQSDIDIAIDTGKQLSFSKIGEANDVLAALNIPYKVDVVDFNGVSQDMKDSISRTGILWS